MYPQSQEVQHYLLNCTYTQIGQNEISLLLTTKVDLDRLVQTDLKGFLGFVQNNLSESLDFANYESDANISKVLNVKRNEDEDFDAFTARVVNETPFEELKHDISARKISIEVNGNFPSEFYGYQSIPAEHAKVLLEYFHPSRIIDLTWAS